MSNIFPATYSSLRSAALGEWAGSQFRLPVTGCRMLLSGVHDSYRIDCPDISYVLRVYRKGIRSSTEVMAELQLLDHLHGFALPVSYPLRNAAGELVSTIPAIEGNREAALFSFAPGANSLRLSPLQLELFGEQVKQLHTTTAGLKDAGNRWTYDLDLCFVRPFELAGAALEKAPADRDWLQQAAATAMEKIGQAGNMPSGAIHFDLMPKNMHFDPVAGLTFFDFDFFGYGLLLYDLVPFWMQLQLDVYNKRMTFDEASSDFRIFVAAYTGGKGLTPVEKELLPQLTLGWWLYYMGFHATHPLFVHFTEPLHIAVRTRLIRHTLEHPLVL